MSKPEVADTTPHDSVDRSAAELADHRTARERTDDRARQVAAAPSPLAHELRRLSRVIIRGAGEAADLDPLSPSSLAIGLAKAFRLRAIDVDVSLVVLGAEIDRDFRALLSSASSRDELGVLAALVPYVEERIDVLDAIGENAPAIQRGLLRRIERDGLAFLSATRRFRSAVRGHHPLAALPTFAEHVERATVNVPWANVPAALLDAMRLARTSAMCLVSGTHGTGKTTWSEHAATAIGGRALRVDAARAVRAGGQAALEVRELLEDAALAGWPAVLDNAGELLTSETRLSLLIEEVLDTTSLKLFVVMDDRDSLHERLSSKALGHVRIGPPPATVRHEIWKAAGIDEGTRQVLANDLSLTPRQIANAAVLIQAGAPPAVAAFEQLPKAHDLTLPDAAYARLDALILPRDVRAELIELIGAIRVRGSLDASGRGRNISALLDGDSGTGKTFACEVIAAEVGLPLMRVNVASLVDKYIGETEKNLARVFAQAQARGGLLFFDEADALFGTRTDVSRSQDRYANLETNLLLQLMERFDGVVLLTTNLKQNIDKAFLRRIMFKIYFEAPEPAEREQIWRLFVPQAIATKIDFKRLATSFELTGGSIRSAALRATLRATANHREISMQDLAECAQIEIQGMGRVSTWNGG